ncbi:MAG TPA: Tad domain-containing protein [Candidatus Polarisedimenticolia bacterium]|nr:Tad domain-containing protein [Candidatus Polarisedimenticolia bacterium]
MRAPRILRDEEGISLLFVSVSMVVLLGMAALAIDVGMLYHAKGQAQNAADSCALAGAGALILSPGDDTVAIATGKQFAEDHEIIKQQVVIVPAEDVIVDLPNGRVTCWARRTEARGNAVPTFFAKVLGFDLVDVQATAIAEIGPADTASCLKPWAIPDAYDDVNHNGIFDAGDYYQKGVTSWGTDYRGPTMDFGVQLVLKVGRPGDAISPGQFFPIDLPIPNSPDTGGDRYRSNIYQCNSSIVQVGDFVFTENGNMVGPTKQGINDLIALDPGAHWVNGVGIEGSAFPPGATPRIGKVPMFDPRFPPTSGKHDLEVTNIAGFFIDGVQGNGTVTGHLVPTTGTGEGGPGLLMTVRLVK